MQNKSACPSSGVLYCRYSSRSQRDVSIEQQIKDCEKFAEKNDIRIVKVYADHALTGTNDKRPKFQQMIAEAAYLDYQYIIVYSLDRFARNRYDSAKYKRELKLLGKKVLSATENISDDPTGILVESLLEGMAEYYSEELSRKIRRGMSDNAEKCMSNGALPYGYRRGVDGKYSVMPSEAAVVQEIYQRVYNGEKFIEIATDLNKRGLKTKSGSEWNKSSFNVMLSNERYTGVYTYRDVRVEGGVPIIIEKELFDAVQQKMKEKKNPRGPQRRRRENGIYLLTGKLFCGNCNSPMVGISGKSSAKTPYHYYVCKKRRQEKNCDKKPVRRDLIETEVARAIQRYVLTDETILKLADIATARHEQNKHDPFSDSLAAELSDVQTSIRNIVAAIEKGIISSSTQKRLTELEQQEALLIERIAANRYKSRDNVSRDDFVALLKLYQKGDINDRDYQESLFDTFVIAVYLYDDFLKIKFNLGTNEGEDVSIPYSEESNEADAEAVVDVRTSSSPLHQQYRPVFI